MAENEAVGQFTNMGVGIGLMSGIGTQVGNQVSQTVATAFTNQENTYCPSCGNMNGINDVFCKQCGKKIEKSKVCPKCNSVLDNTAMFCSKCGERVG